MNHSVSEISAYLFECCRILIGSAATPNWHRANRIPGAYRIIARSLDLAFHSLLYISDAYQPLPLSLPICYLDHVVRIYTANSSLQIWSRAVKDANRYS